MYFINSFNLQLFQKNTHKAQKMQNIRFLIHNKLIILSDHLRRQKKINISNCILCFPQYYLTKFIYRHCIAFINNVPA